MTPAEVASGEVKCLRCGDIKSLSAFGRNQSKSTGYQDWCKACTADYNRKRNEKEGWRSRGEYFSWPERLYWNARRSAKAKKYSRKFSAELDVSIDQKWVQEQLSKQGFRCYWTGVPFDMDLSRRDTNPRSPSLDRLDNNRGYTPDNVIICMWCVNRMRGATSVAEFSEIIHQIKITTNRGDS